MQGIIGIFLFQNVNLVLILIKIVRHFVPHAFLHHIVILVIMDILFHNMENVIALHLI